MKYVLREYIGVCVCVWIQIQIPEKRHVDILMYDEAIPLYLPPCSPVNAGEVCGL